MPSHDAFPSRRGDSKESQITALFLFLAFIAAAASCSITQNPGNGLLIMGSAIALSIVFNIVFGWRRKRLQESSMKETEEAAQNTWSAKRNSYK